MDRLLRIFNLFVAGRLLTVDNLFVIDIKLGQATQIQAPLHQPALPASLNLDVHTKMTNLNLFRSPTDSLVKGNGNVTLLFQNFMRREDHGPGGEV